MSRLDFNLEVFSFGTKYRNNKIHEQTILKLAKLSIPWEKYGFKPKYITDVPKEKLNSKNLILFAMTSPHLEDLTSVQEVPFL